MIFAKLKKRGLEKVQRGHLWLYADETEDVFTDVESGVANIFYKDEFLGKALYNSKSKNALKLLTYEDREINRDFFAERFRKASRLRKDLPPFRREINAEGDLLPGLIVDRFAGVLVLQVRALALEAMKNEIIDALVEVYSPESIYERSDFESLPEYGLSRSKGLLYGEKPEVQIVEENGLKFMADVVMGQKTGFFYDQRDSRAFVRENVRGKKALDLFSYTGGFALTMAGRGLEVDAVDLSEPDVGMARKNAEINGLNANFMRGDAFDLQNLGTYDFVVADPPSLVKSKEERRKASGLLKGLADQIFDHLSPVGTVGICSCAYNIDSELLMKAVLASSTDKKRIVRPIRWTGLPADHPHLLSMPETDYLKCLWFEAVSREEI